jgi:hypothetical protein
VSYAFDSLTEEKIANIKRLFGDKQIHDLIFDEAPYKTYSAKVTGTATIKHIPFDDAEEGRIYKGEGSIQFTCFYPFARCTSTDKQWYINKGYTNVDEWWEASRINEGGNFGDVPVPFEFNLKDNGSIELEGGTVAWTNMPANVVLNTRFGLAMDEEGNIFNDRLTGNSTLKI